MCRAPSTTRTGCDGTNWSGTRAWRSRTKRSASPWPAPCTSLRMSGASWTWPHGVAKTDRRCEMVAYLSELVDDLLLDKRNTWCSEAPGFEGPSGYHIRRT